MNIVILTGRITAVPELNHTATGTPVCDANLAVDDYVNGEKKTLFFGLKFWNSAAENLVKHVTKGQKLAIRGKLSQEQFTPKGQDKEVSKTRVVVESFEFGERPMGAGSGESARQAAPAARQSPAPQPEPSDDEGEGGEIPF